ncbi:MAG: amidase [Pseudomonadota bacterium]
MEFSEYDTYDATALAALVRSGDVSANELLDIAIGRIESRDGDINAIVTKMYDEARASIAAGLPDGPFRGVPFSLKDLGLNYAGVPTTNGSRLFEAFTPQSDATLVARYRAAGLVILGKTNTPELGVAATTEPALHGPTRNPWSLSHSAGGSSGGAAAAVAAGYMPIAHATDGGGSIRIPAANCGLVGLKPTRGRNPVGPDIGEGMAGMSIGHCVSRTVRDAARLLDATAGAAPGDPYAAPPPARPFAEEVGATPGRLRIAFMTTDFEGGAVAAECVQAVEATVSLLESLGHHVEEARPNVSDLSLTAAWRVIAAANLAVTTGARCDALGRSLRDDDIEPITQAWLAETEKHTGADYLRTVMNMHRIGRRFGEFFETYDLICTPTMGTPPIGLGEMSMQSNDLDQYFDFLFGTVAPFTAVFNQSGGAAISLPLHWSVENLPIGVQLGGALGCEPILIRVASQLESARPWADKRPAAYFD